jgi:hypothetical protein
MSAIKFLTKRIEQELPNASYEEMMILFDMIKRNFQIEGMVDEDESHIPVCAIVYQNDDNITKAVEEAKARNEDPYHLPPETLPYMKLATLEDVLSTIPDIFIDDPTGKLLEPTMQVLETELSEMKETIEYLRNNQ